MIDAKFTFKLMTDESLIRSPIVGEECGEEEREDRNGHIANQQNYVGTTSVKFYGS